MRKMMQSRAAIGLAIIICLAGWSGTLRTGDLKVYRVSVPAPQAAFIPGDSRVFPTEIRSVFGEGEGHLQFDVEVDFQVSPPSGESFLARTVYRIGPGYQREPPQGVQREITQERLAKREQSLRGKVYFGAGSTALLRVVGEPGVLARLDVAGRSFRYPAPTLESGESGAQTSLRGLTVVAAKEYLTVERVESATGAEQRVNLLKLPSTESPAEADVQVLPLVDLTALGLAAPVQALAIMTDHQTIALIPESQENREQYEIWLVRLPGTLSVSAGPVYLIAAITVLFAGVLMLYAFKRK